MGRCVITRGRQALELRSNLSERRSLTDRIQVSQCSASSSARNLQWAIAHGKKKKLTEMMKYFKRHISTRIYLFIFSPVLPESRYLQFDCGVKVQLGFAAEFSNVMVIYTRILDKPDEIVSCSAQLTDFPEVCDTLFHLDLKSLWFNTEQTRFYPGLNLLLQLLKAQASNWKCTELYRVFVSLLQDVDIDLKKSNQESLLEAGCLLLIKEELPSPEAHSLYTHIRSLQRLKVCHFPLFLQ